MASLRRNNIVARKIHSLYFLIRGITPLDFTRSEGYEGSDDNDTIEKLLEYYI